MFPSNYESCASSKDEEFNSSQNFDYLIYYYWNSWQGAIKA